LAGEGGARIEEPRAGQGERRGEEHQVGPEAMLYHLGKCPTTVRVTPRGYGLSYSFHVDYRHDSSFAEKRGPSAGSRAGFRLGKRIFHPHGCRSFSYHLYKETA